MCVCVCVCVCVREFQQNEWASSKNIALGSWFSISTYWGQRGRVYDPVQLRRGSNWLHTWGSWPQALPRLTPSIMSDLGKEKIEDRASNSAAQLSVKNTILYKENATSVISTGGFSRGRNSSAYQGKAGFSRMENVFLKWFKISHFCLIITSSPFLNTDYRITSPTCYSHTCFLSPPKQYFGNLCFCCILLLS